jgi:hypothetical protein
MSSPTVDSAQVSWTTSSDYPQMVVESVQPTANAGNDCYVMSVTATIQNEGTEWGGWRVRAFYYPSGETYTAADAIEASEEFAAQLDPGQSGQYAFKFQPPAGFYTPVVDPFQCPGTEISCDRSFDLLEVQGSQVVQETLGVYTNRDQLDSPDASVALFSPTGARLMFVYDPTTRFTDVYRETNAGYSLSGTVQQYVNAAVVASGQVLVFGFDDNGVYESFELDENTAALSNVASTGVPIGNQGREAPLVDVYTGALYAFIYNGSADTFTVSQYDNGTWTTILSASWPTEWRGNALTYTSIGLTSIAANGILWIPMELDWGSGFQEVWLRLDPTQGIDLEHAFPDPESLYETIAVTPSGDPFRIVSCNWNLDPRLCFQTGAATQDCFDDDPCTQDLWDPSTATCTHPPLVCPPSGNLCAGPQVCDQTSGQCMTDTSQAVTCSGGSYCTGTQSCDPSSGQCVTGTPPQIDDGIACTVDACSDASQTVTHTPSNAACYADACHTATCSPGASGADATTGCLVTAITPQSDGLACTTDSCDPATGSTIHTIQTGYCVIDNTCYSSGAANPSNACQVCDPSGSAAAWTSVSDDTPCDDNLFCTTGDKCVAGECVGTPLDCAAGTSPACQVATCSEAMHECVVNNVPDGTSCDDFNVCNGHETCLAGTCMAGTPWMPDTSNPCVTQTCDPINGVSSSPTPGSCNADSNGCTQNDYCDAGSCVAGPTVDCGPYDNQCNVGLCVSTGNNSSMCVLDPTPLEGASCDDNVYCNGADTCHNGTCEHSGSPCAAGPSCTTTACDEASASCVQTVNTGYCLVDGGCVLGSDPSCGGSDAGSETDAGSQADAGIPVDAGEVEGVDAGVDAGGIDSGQTMDAGLAEDGGIDSGVMEDAGYDAGSPTEADGGPDSGSSGDGGQPQEDAGSSPGEGGTDGGIHRSSPAGCSCGSGAIPDISLLSVLLLALPRARRRKNPEG